MKIKTIHKEHCPGFDELVNDALAEGWQIHDLLVSRGSHIAYLYKDDDE